MPKLILNFQGCLTAMLNSLSDKTITISKYYKVYFENEELGDLFEGFLRLLSTSEEFNKRLNTTNNNNKKFSYTLIFNSFYERIQQLTETEKDLILNAIPADPKILYNGLKIIAKLNLKYLEEISEVFCFYNEKRRNSCVAFIRNIIKGNEIEKAIEWMVHFDLRDQFHFDKLADYLYKTEQYELLRLFVGDDMYRMKRLIAYLDIKIGLEIKRHIVSRLPLGESAKKLEYVTTKYLELFHLPEEIASNMMDLRLRLADPTILLTGSKWTRRGSGTFTSSDDDGEEIKN